MQDLKLENEFFLHVFEGTKTATIRRGHLDIMKGALAFESVDGGWGVIVNVTDIKHKKFSELTESEIKNIDPTEVAFNIASDSDVSVISFEFKDALDIPDFFDSDEFPSS